MFCRRKNTDLGSLMGQSRVHYAIQQETIRD